MKCRRCGKTYIPKGVTFVVFGGEEICHCKRPDIPKSYISSY